MPIPPKKIFSRFFLVCLVFFALLKISLAPVFNISHDVHVFYFLSAILFVFSNVSNLKHIDGLYINYIVVMLIGGLFHYISDRVENAWSEAIFWCFPIIMLSFYSPKNKNRMLVLMVFAVFFVEFLTTYYEQITNKNFFDFKSELYTIEQGYKIEDTKYFRSYGIFGHPLSNANIISIFTGFLLCSKIKTKIKSLLVICGLLSILCTNSRGVLLIWAIILFYYFFMRNKKWYITGLFLLGGLLAFPYIIEILSNFGRLSQGIDDEGALTRMTAFVVFVNQKWDISHILLGGDKIQIPGSILLIENGVLLTLGYWGWVIGSLKILLELMITNKILCKYATGEKLVLFLAVWGVAITNNNTFNDFVLICLVIVYMAFDSLNTQLERRRERSLYIDNRHFN